MAKHDNLTSENKIVEIGYCIHDKVALYCLFIDS
jgi:hypothetical protein